MTEKHVHLFLKLQSKDNLLNTNYSKDLLVLLTDIIKNYLTPVNDVTFDFPYGGHSGAIILAESHLTWHSFPEDEYLNALKRIPIWKRETVTKVVSFYQKLCKQITELSYAKYLVKKQEEHLEIAHRVGGIGH